MPSHIIGSRPPRGARRRLTAVTDPDIIRTRLEDAAHYPGGRASALFAPESEAEIGEVLRGSAAVLVVGAQSSLTGGATPMGDTLLATDRLAHIERIDATSVRAQAGVTVAALDVALSAAGRYYPPTPTFTGATVGGIVSTNAAGAATFKYGTTRGWVEALTVVLATGDVLDIVRGETTAHPDGFFELQLAAGPVRVEIPPIVMPLVPKVSAGYFAAPQMDLIDLFVGSEGTLGIVTEVTLRVVPHRPAFCLAFVVFDDVGRGLAFVRRTRDEARRAASDGRGNGLTVSAIEHLDGRCLALLRDAGADVRCGVVLPPCAGFAALITLELPAGSSSADAYAQLAEPAVATPLGALAALLAEFDVLDTAHIAPPGDAAGQRRLLELREGVPAAVNAWIARLKATDGGDVQKIAADVIVPFDRLEVLIEGCARAFATRGLDAAVWGHISDGNLHPNVLPHTAADVVAGKQAVLEIGREAIRLGGSPMAEHGVGRNPIKQQLLRELYGEDGVNAMRRVKRALDPEWKLAPGVLFDR